MTLTRARLMKILTTKPTLSFEEWDKILWLALRGLDNTRIARQDTFNIASTLAGDRIDAINAEIDALKKAMPNEGGETRDRYLGKIGELIEVKDAFIVHRQDLLKAREALFEPTTEEPTDGR